MASDRRKMTEGQWHRRGVEQIGLLAVAAAAAVAAYMVAGRLKHELGTGELMIPGEIGVLLVCAALVLVAGAAALGARRTGWAMARPLGAVTAGFLAGSLGGAIVAPSYVPPRSYPGSIELRIESGVSRVASGPADCRSVPDGTDFALASASLIGLGPYAVAVSASLRGGLSQDGVPRRDGIGLMIVELPPAGEVPVGAGAPAEFVADDSAVLSTSTQGGGDHMGSMAFSNVRQTKGTGAFGLAGPIILSGVVTWSCQMP